MVSRTDWHCFFNCPERASCKEGARQAPGWYLMPPTPPRQHLQPDPSGASPAEQWGLSESGWPLSLPGQHSPFLAGGGPLGPAHCTRCGPASAGFPVGRNRRWLPLHSPDQALCIFCKRTSLPLQRRKKQSSEKTSPNPSS